MNHLGSVRLIKDLTNFLSSHSQLACDDISQISSVFLSYMGSESILFPEKSKRLIGDIVFPSNRCLAKQLFTLTTKQALVEVVFSNEAISHQSWILRSVLSRLKLYKQQARCATSANHDLIDDISREGFVVINNFLSPKSLSNVKSELVSLPYAVNAIQAGLLRPRIKLSPSYSFFLKRRGLHESCQSLKDVIKLIDSLGYTPSRSITRQCIYSSSFCQRLKILAQDGDHQKDSHVDTFFPSLKFWYFLTSVSDSESFQYAPSSHNLTFKRMVSESAKISGLLKHKCMLEKSPSGVSQLEGSLRFSKSDLDEIDLKLQPVSVQSNSLVIADTSGIHSRGAGQQPDLAVDRLALHGAVRHGFIF